MWCHTIQGITMKNTIKLATTVALATVAVCSFSVPASAFDFGSILQSLSQGMSGWTDLDARENEISSQLSVAASSGQLSVAEADGFKVELNRVMQVETQIKSSGRGLGATDAISFTNSLNNLTSRIDMAIQAKSSSSSANLASVDGIRAKLEARINEARAAHTMTRTDFESVNNDLQHNANIQSALTMSGGNITDRQAQVLLDDLARIRISINQHITVAQAGVPQLSSQRRVIEQRIATGLSGGTIKGYQADKFKQDLARIATMQANFLTADGVLSNNEVLAVASELDRLSSRVDYQISMSTNDTTVNTSYGRDDYDRGNGYEHGRGDGHGYGRDNHRGEQVSKDIDERRAQLLVRLNTAQNNRKLSRYQVSQLRTELDRIADSQAQLKSSGGGRISYDQSTKIMSDLTSLQQHLDEQLARRANGSTGYRQY
jgi:hypothetical protein